jgi:hypothetical protein
MSDESKSQPTSPDPESAIKPASIKPASPARERTLRHMRRLLAKAAFAGAALEGAGCIPIVCDPLPPPVTCQDGVTTDELSAATWWEAHWAQGPGGLNIQLQVGVYAENLTFSGAPSCEGATLESFGREDYELTVLCTPTQGATTVTISIPMKCDAGTDVTLHLTLDVSGTPAVGGTIPVTITD